MVYIFYATKIYRKLLEWGCCTFDVWLIFTTRSDPLCLLRMKWKDRAPQSMISNVMSTVSFASIGCCISSSTSSATSCHGAFNKRPWQCFWRDKFTYWQRYILHWFAFTYWLYFNNPSSIILWVTYTATETSFLQFDDDGCQCRVECRVDPPYPSVFHDDSWMMLYFSGALCSKNARII